MLRGGTTGQLHTRSWGEQVVFVLQKYNEGLMGTVVV
jgi:hypothetical protein